MVRRRWWGCNIKFILYPNKNTLLSLLFVDYQKGEQVALWYKIMKNNYKVDVQINIFHTKLTFCYQALRADDSFLYFKKKT